MTPSHLLLISFLLKLESIYVSTPNTLETWQRHIILVHMTMRSLELMSCSAVLLNLTVMTRSTNTVISPCRLKGFHLLWHIWGPTTAGLQRYSVCSCLLHYCCAAILQPSETVANCVKCSSCVLWCCSGMTALVLSVFPNVPFSGSSHTFVFIGFMPPSAMSCSLQKWECQDMWCFVLHQYEYRSLSLLWYLMYIYQLPVVEHSLKSIYLLFPPIFCALLCSCTRTQVAPCSLWALSASSHLSIFSDKFPLLGVRSSISTGCNYNQQTWLGIWKLSTMVCLHPQVSSCVPPY
jgi:hypothetical protein